jgi:hypothetical protein
MSMSEREDLQEVLDKLGWKYKVPEQREGYAKVEQEPVAWMYDWNIPVERNQEILHAYKSRNHLTTDLTLVLNDVNDVENIRPLYTSPPTREPLSDSILSKEVDIIKKDADFSNVRPWQIYCLMRKTEELHGIGVDDEKQ